MGTSDILTVRLKIFGAIAVTGIVLWFIMGYNLGSLTEDTRQQRLLDGKKGLVQAQQARHKVCKNTLKTMRSGASTQENHNLLIEANIATTKDELTSRTKLLKQLAQEQEACHDERLTAREMRGRKNYTKIITDLRQRQLQTAFALKRKNSTNAVGLKIRKSYVRALRLANDALVLRIKAKREYEERQRVAAEEQKRDAENKAKEDAIKQALRAKETEEELQKIQEEAKSDVERVIAENKKSGGLLEWDDEASDQRMALDSSEGDRRRKPRKITADSEAENLLTARVSSAEHSQESSTSMDH